MPVYNCKIIIIVFLADNSSGILTKSADLVFKRTRISYKFAFIEYTIHFFHDLVSHFYPNADVHGSGLMRDIVFSAYTFKPIGAAAPCCHDGMIGTDFKILPSSQ